MKNPFNPNGVSVTFTHINATTVSPNFVTEVITPNADLRRKTALVVIEEKAEVLSVYRQSGKVSGRTVGTSISGRTGNENTRGRIQTSIMIHRVLQRERFAGKVTVFRYGRFPNSAMKNSES